MPKPLAVDWQFIQALWLQGIPPAKIESQTGVKIASIRSRAYRLGWQIARYKAEATLARPLEVSLAGQIAKAHSKALAKASEQAQAGLSDEVSDQLAVLKHRKPRTLAELANTSRREGRASVVSKLVSTAAKLYGWDAQNQQPAVLNLTQVNQVSPTQVAKVIDVSES